MVTTPASSSAHHVGKGRAENSRMKASRDLLRLRPFDDSRHESQEVKTMRDVLIGP
jgi:hypothetical protein